MLILFGTFSYREGPGPSIRYHWETSLKEMVTSAKVKQPKKLFYLRLTMPITELESKRQFKCTWVDSRLKVKSYTVKLKLHSVCLKLYLYFSFDLLKKQKHTG